MVHRNKTLFTLMNQNQPWANFQVISSIVIILIIFIQVYQLLSKPKFTCQAQLNNFVIIIITNTSTANKCDLLSQLSNTELIYSHTVSLNFFFNKIILISHDECHQICSDDVLKNLTHLCTHTHIQNCIQTELRIQI